MHAYAGRQFVPFLWWSLVWPGREANSRPTVREADTLPTEPTRHGLIYCVLLIRHYLITIKSSMKWQPLSLLCKQTPSMTSSPICITTPSIMPVLFVTHCFKMLFLNKFNCFKICKYYYRIQHLCRPMTWVLTISDRPAGAVPRLGSPVSLQHPPSLHLLCISASQTAAAAERPLRGCDAGVARSSQSYVSEH